MAALIRRFWAWLNNAEALASLRALEAELASLRRTQAATIRQIDRMDSDLRIVMACEADAEDDDPEACPGCGCRPGDGITAGCFHPHGCGFNRRHATA